jgi:hypothetical protein
MIFYIHVGSTIEPLLKRWYWHKQDLNKQKCNNIILRMYACMHIRNMYACMYDSIYIYVYIYMYIL